MIIAVRWLLRVTPDARPVHVSSALALRRASPFRSCAPETLAGRTPARSRAAVSSTAATAEMTSPGPTGVSGYPRAFDGSTAFRPTKGYDISVDNAPPSSAKAGSRRPAGIPASLPDTLRSRATHHAAKFHAAVKPSIAPHATWNCRGTPEDGWGEASPFAKVT